MGQLAIYASPLPFSNKQVKAVAIVGSTVQEIVDLVCPPRLVGHVDVIVQINGHIVPQNRWASVRPKENTVTNVRIIPQGGGGGKKNPLVTILSIAVMIAAPQIGASLAASISAASNITLATSLTLGRIITGVVGIVGSMLVNALAPPPKPSNAGLTSNPEESPTQFIEGAQNSLNPFGVVPICLGTNRMVPPQAARGFTETENDDQYARQLFCWGYGDTLLLTDIKIGETDISQFTDIQMEHRLSGDLHLSTGLFPNDPFQENFNVLLRQTDGYTTRTTQNDIDEAIIDVTFPQGLTRYSELGNRNVWEVELDIEYAPSGVSPQVWSSGASYKSCAGATIAVTAASMVESYITISGTQYYVGYRKDLVVVDFYTGAISIIHGTGVTNNSAAAQAPSLPQHKIRLSTILVLTKKTKSASSSAVTTIESYTDDRDPSLFGGTFEDSGDFLVSTSGTNILVDVGAISNELTISSAQSEALRRSIRIVFPESGTYDIRIRRVTTDSVSTTGNQIFDEVYLTAIKSITHQAPVNLEGVNGTAIRIKGTDQLNGAIDQLNALVSNVILDYDTVGGWTPRATSNPASIYRYVLQGAANAKPMTDDKIDLTAIEEWHTHCAAQGYSYNRVIDYDTSVDEILRDVAAAGAASPAIVDGKRTIVVDQVKEDIVQIITPRNSWGYSGEIVYPDLPHAFRVQFRNAAKGYQQDERIVYDDGYDADNATSFEVLELQSCTSADLAFKTGRRHIAAARLRRETHTFMMDVENLVALRGNRIKFEHDVPIIGIGDGRIKAVETTGGSPDLVTGITVDDKITVPSASTYYVRIRLSDGSLLYKEVVTAVGETDVFEFAIPFSVDDAPAIGDLCYFVEAGGEVDLVITRIEPADDLTAKITALDYAPAIFTAESSTIPPFDSHITTPLEFQRPTAPSLIEYQSDEAVMLRNSDGSFLTRAIFKLQNENKGEIAVTVKIRRTGTTAFVNANVLEASPERLILTGLEDGKRYDFHIRYRRAGATMLSLPLELNNYLFEGATGTPEDVTGLRYTISGKSILLDWDKNAEIDVTNYEMRLSGALSDVGWNESQLLEETIFSNRIVVPYQSGTYLLKARDILGNMSVNAVSVAIPDLGETDNVVEVLNESSGSPIFPGIKDNVEIDETGIILTDLSQDGYYYFAADVDLGAVFSGLLRSTIVAGGFNVSSGANDLFEESDLFAMDDMFGIGEVGWYIELQYRVTELDPNGSPAGYGEWAEFKAGFVAFWGIQFRLLLRSLAQNVSPKVTTLIVNVDMPDRIERGEGLTVPVGGATITYSPEFKNNPSVSIQLRNGDAADNCEFTSKTSAGFTFKVYNATSATYVERIYDHISSGYGRKQ